MGRCLKSMGLGAIDTAISRGVLLCLTVNMLLPVRIALMGVFPGEGRFVTH